MNLLSCKHNLRRRIAAVAVTVAASVGVIAGSTSAASAWTYSGSSGRPGNATLPVTYAMDVVTPTGATQFTLAGNTGVTVFRSHASTGVQNVTVMYVLETWTGSAWVPAAKSAALSRQIPAGVSSTTFAAPYLQPTVARGYFRMSYVVSWATTTGGTLGSTAILSTATNEHACATTSRFCSVFAGYFRTGGYRTGAW